MVYCLIYFFQSASQVSGVSTVPENVRIITMDAYAYSDVTALQTSTVIMSEDACVEIPVAIVQMKVGSPQHN